MDFGTTVLEHLGTWIVCEDHIDLCNPTGEFYQLFSFPYLALTKTLNFVLRWLGTREKTHHLNFLGVDLRLGGVSKVWDPALRIGCHLPQLTTADLIH